MFLKLGKQMNSFLSYPWNACGAEAAKKPANLTSETGEGSPESNDLSSWAANDGALKEAVPS